MKSVNQLAGGEIRVRQPRWALVGVPLLVVFGIFWMHSIGHSPTGHDGPAMAASHAAMSAAATHDTQAAMIAVLAPSQPETGMAPMALCIAILTALVIAVGLTAMRVRSQGSRWTSPGARCTPGAGRGPPVLFGLLVADLSVLRN